MANIRNDHVAPLGIPGGPIIPPGRTVYVPRWDSLKDHETVAAWVAAGHLVDVTPPAPKSSEPAEKDAKAKP